MLPTFQLGPWLVNTYSAMVALALMAGGMYSTHRLLQLAGPPGVIVRGLILTILAGLGSTLLMYYLSNLYLVARYGALAAKENMRIIWTLLGGGIVGILYCRKYRVSLGRIFDAGAALPVPLGLTIGRLGCTAAGCCYGKLTNSWLGMYLPDEAGVWAMRYPTQLMSMAANLLTFVILFNLERYTLRRNGGKRGWPFDGFLTLLFMALYSFKRVVVGVLRENGPALVGPFTWMELVALASLIVSVGLLIWNLARTRSAFSVASRQVDS